MTGQVKTPWHLWAVGAATLLWNGFGATQWYFKTMHSPAFWGDLTLAQAQYLQNAPMWTDVAFGVGVWTGVLGGLMLLLRRKLAFNAFVASLIAVLVSTLYSQVLSNGREIMGVSTLFAAVAVILVAAASIAYSRFARQRGIIR